MVEYKNHLIQYRGKNTLGERGYKIWKLKNGLKSVCVAYTFSNPFDWVDSRTDKKAFGQTSLDAF